MVWAVLATLFGWAGELFVSKHLSAYWTVEQPMYYSERSMLYR